MPTLCPSELSSAWLEDLRRFYLGNIFKNLFIKVSKIRKIRGV